METKHADEMDRLVKEWWKATSTEDSINEPRPGGTSMDAPPKTWANLPKRLFLGTLNFARWVSLIAVFLYADNWTGWKMTSYVFGNAVNAWRLYNRSPTEGFNALALEILDQLADANQWDRVGSPEASLSGDPPRVIRRGNLTVEGLPRGGVTVKNGDDEVQGMLQSREAKVICRRQAEVAIEIVTRERFQAANRLRRARETPIELLANK